MRVLVKMSDPKREDANHPNIQKRVKRCFLGTFTWPVQWLDHISEVIPSICSGTKDIYPPVIKHGVLENGSFIGDFPMKTSLHRDFSS